MTPAAMVLTRARALYRDACRDRRNYERTKHLMSPQHYEEMSQHYDDLRLVWRAYAWAALADLYAAKGNKVASSRCFDRVATPGIPPERLCGLLARAEMTLDPLAPLPLDPLVPSPADNAAVIASHLMNLPSDELDALALALHIAGLTPCPACGSELASPTGCLACQAQPPRRSTLTHQQLMERAVVAAAARGKHDPQHDPQ